MITAVELRARIGRLVAERIEAVESGLGSNAVYMTELEQDIADSREAYVGMAVTEIATLRAELSGPQFG